MKTQFANYKDGQVTINSYRFADAQVTDVEDILSAVENKSDEVLVASIDTDDEMEALKCF